jgi:hypothetical protein
MWKHMIFSFGKCKRGLQFSIGKWKRSSEKVEWGEENISITLMQLTTRVLLYYYNYLAH